MEKITGFSNSLTSCVLSINQIANTIPNKMQSVSASYAMFFENNGVAILLYIFLVYMLYIHFIFTILLGVNTVELKCVCIYIFFQAMLALISSSFIAEYMA